MYKTVKILENDNNRSQKQNRTVVKSQKVLDINPDFLTIDGHTVLGKLLNCSMAWPFHLEYGNNTS